MTQVLDRPPVINQSTGQRFYLLAVSLAPTLYWGGNAWSSSSGSAQGFASYAFLKRGKTKSQQKSTCGGICDRF